MTETVEFVHPRLNQEIEAIGGRYLILKEETLNIGGRDVLYLVGCGVFDTSCCGAGGAGYALVPGFLVAATIHPKAGNPVSRVEPVRDPEKRREIEKAIMARESLTQVNFL